MIPFKRVISVGMSDPTIVPPGPIVKISVPTVTAVVTMGMGMTVVELERTKVSETAVGDG